MPPSKDAFSKRLRDSLANRKKLQAACRQDGHPLQEFVVGWDLLMENEIAREMSVERAFALDPQISEDASILAAFSAAGLNPKNPIDWRTLMKLFCEVHFGPAKTKPKSWTEFEYFILAKQALELYPKIVKRGDKLTATKLAEELQKSFEEYEDYNADAFRKRVREALSLQTYSATLMYPNAPSLAHSAFRAQWEASGRKWASYLDETLSALYDFNEKLGN